MEFNTTQSFVKALEGVYESGVLESPVVDDVKLMIDLAYQNGTIEESIKYFNDKYPYYMVKNMHQLFLQITKEGAKDSGESLENMLLDIDMLVEGVYRDKMDRSAFHKKFLTFGFGLYLLVMLTQFLLGTENYIKMLDEWYVQVLLHLIIIINTYFLISVKNSIMKIRGRVIMMLEILILGVLIYIILEYNGSISTNKFVMDNSDLFKKLKERILNFMPKAKYGDSVDVEKLFNVRLRNGLLVILMMVFLFITDLNYANILFCLIAGYGVLNYHICN